VSESLRIIEDCFVTGSSGCHRYDYWNEQALFDGRTDTGWCTPSRTQEREEFLEIDLGGSRVPARIRLQARPIEDWPGFPRELRALVRAAGADDWTQVLHAKDVAAPAGQWWEADLDPVSATSLRIEVDQVGRRKNGAYFLQFMQLQVLEEAGR
jgi:hypothetical protein